MAKKEKEIYDSERIYDCLKQYISYYIEKTEKDAECKENLKNGEKGEDEKEPGDERTLNYEIMIKNISKGGIDSLGVFVDALIRIKDEQNEWVSIEQEILTQKELLLCFKDFRSSLPELYPILDRINNAFDVDKYYELSLSPNASIYGSILGNNSKKSPLKNDNIIYILEMFLEKEDYNRFSAWIKEILLFSTAKMVDGFQDYISERNSLREWIKEQILKNVNYREGMSQEFLSDLIDSFYKKDRIEKEKDQLKREKQEFIERIEELEKNLDELNKKQELKDKQIAEISLDLNKKESDFEKCKETLDDVFNRAIMLEKERDDLKENVLQRDEELLKKNNELEEANLKSSAMQSDLSLKNNELKKLKDDSNRIEKIAQSEIKKELIDGLNDQLFYLTLFYLDFMDNGKLNEENIELYSNTLNEIDDVFEKIGIKKIGLIDEAVKYDSAMYCTNDASVADGDSVIVKGFGWIVGDEVYIKAPVEKGE